MQLGSKFGTWLLERGLTPRYGYIGTNKEGCGGLTEQIDKSSGNPTSATDLTWSYASAITAFKARGGAIPASWGAAGLAVPATCSTGGGGGSGGATVAVTLNVQATTVYGGTS